MSIDQLWDVAMSVKPASRQWIGLDGRPFQLYPTAMGIIQVDGHKVTATIEWVWRENLNHFYGPANKIGPMVVAECARLPVDIVRPLGDQRQE